MSPKRVNKKKKINFKGLTSLVPKKIDFDKIKINPSNIIEHTKGKIGNFYENLKKEREKEKKRLEKKRLLDEKKEALREKKQAQRDKLNKIKEEKKQILIQKKLIIDNEKQCSVFFVADTLPPG